MKYLVTVEPDDQGNAKAQARFEGLASEEPVEAMVDMVGAAFIALIRTAENMDQRVAPMMGGRSPFQERLAAIHNARNQAIAAERAAKPKIVLPGGHGGFNGIDNAVLRGRPRSSGGGSGGSGGSGAVN